MLYPFTDDELLYHGVLPGDMYWTKSGRPSSAAFKTRPRDIKDGISADRQRERTPAEALAFARKHLTKGPIVTVTVKDVRQCEAEVRSTPHEDNEYHCSIRGKEKVPLTSSQEHRLAQVAQIVFSLEEFKKSSMS